eukprot:m.138251 g.138251  ORF g.138251 m.138251 type:complete len:393 (+) comp17022_c0_seq1:27-1205(+)
MPPSLAIGLLALAAAAAVAAPADANGCTSASDCQLNGACVQGACQCDKGWQGPACGNLSLAAPVVAYGYGNSAVSKGTAPSSSWGGGPPVYDAATKQYHLFVTEIAGHCGMCTWGRMSQAVHAVSPTVEGPYRRLDVAVPTQTHNTYYAYSPTDKVHLIYHIGPSDNPSSCNPYYNCSQGFTPECSGLRPPTDWPKPTCATQGPAYVHYSKSLDGPWLDGGRCDINKTGMPPAAGASNPAPYIFPNGTVLLVARGKDASSEHGHHEIMHNIFLYRAPAWNARYEWVRGHGVNGSLNIGNGKVPTEDPVIWRGRRGFHILFHSHPGLTHAWSENGLSWQWSGDLIGPYVAPGKGDHERPRVAIDASGDLDAVFVSQEIGPNDASCTFAFKTLD